ncbi:MAG TPA: glycosyltransferase family 39 protein [Thermoanaerobaculia bacterium]|nr:glycosyltransferase family 39 protein [Thermoanaerobaculia bacterium]
MTRAFQLALLAHALFFLALAGQLRAWSMAIVIAIAIVVVMRRVTFTPRAWLALLFLPVLVLALYPPLAFDETLYHLPYVRALATSGELRFLRDVRFGAFPQLHELLCVPLFAFVGDTATHLVALLEVLLTAGVLFEWGRRYDERAGWLASALFLGSPIVIHLGTITYADAALTLFVTAGFAALDRARDDSRPWLALSGFLLGTACSVKYLGFFFAAAAFVVVALLFRERLRALATFALATLAAALPMTLWLFATTGNPVFPFLPSVFGTTAWSFSQPRAAFSLRVLWDVTFARERVNSQPPFTPLFLAMVVIVLVAAWHSVAARCVAMIVAAYLVAFSFLPQDSRYLVPLLPLLGIVAAVTVARRWLRAVPALAMLAIAPGIAYALYRIAILGIPPTTAAQREAWLTQRVPEYAALMRAGNASVYVYGAERLKYYARGELLGDVIGPYSHDRVRRIDTEYLLVAKSAKPAPRIDGNFVLVYEDAAAQLWRQDKSPHAR